MPLIAGNTEVLADLTVVLATFVGTRFIGLFQNDWTMRHESVIGEVQVANFSGYAGLKPVTAWAAPTLVRGQYQSQAAPLTWTRGAGVNNNWIFGYYVVDAGGVLRWAERDPNGPVAIVNVGNAYTVTPRFSLGSRY